MFKNTCHLHVKVNTVASRFLKYTLKPNFKKKKQLGWDVCCSFSSTIKKKKKGLSL